MWWLLLLIGIVLVAAVAAVVVSGRRATVGGDARDRFVNPARNRPTSGMDKYSEHGGPLG